MSKYKHKKTGILANKYNNDTYSVQGGGLLQAIIIEYSNDWEEVKPWKILEFRDHSSSYTLRENGNYLNKLTLGSFPGATLKNMFDLFGVIIYSVLRSEDNVKFELGDVMRCWDGDHRITEIKMHNGDPVFFAQHTGSMSSAYTLDHIKKVERKKILTTTDGVDLFIGDYYYTIGTLGIPSKYPVVSTTQPGYNVFSNEEAAKKWFDLNMVRFSKAQILEKQEELKKIYPFTSFEKFNELLGIK